MSHTKSILDFTLQTTGGKSTRTCESSGDEQCTDHDQNSDVENGQRNLRSPTPESTHVSLIYIFLNLTCNLFLTVMKLCLLPV